MNTTSSRPASEVFPYVEVRALLKDTRTGESKWIKDLFLGWQHCGDQKVATTPHDVWSYWTAGNNSCDCNRQMLFYPDTAIRDAECGESRFQLIQLEINGTLYSE